MEGDAQGRVEDGALASVAEESSDRPGSGRNTGSAQRSNSLGRRGTLRDSPIQSEDPPGPGPGSQHRISSAPTGYGPHSRLPPIDSHTHGQVLHSSGQLMAAMSSMADTRDATDYQVAHHSLRLKTRGPSTFIKRHQHAQAQRPGANLYSTGQGGLAAHPGTAQLAAMVAMQTAHRAEHQVEPAQSQWNQSSVGDLEVLDGILDHLVVLDAKMRSALLRGPLISFETVVPEPRLPGASKMNAEEEERLKDMTFLTSVKVTQDLLPEVEEEEEAPPTLSQPPSAAPLAAAAMDIQLAQQQQQAMEMDALRGSIPVPVLPKIARQLASTRASQAAKAPPPPPATAEYLLRTRPQPQGITAAPTYDELCSQIRDVQRQYTCGTAKEKMVVSEPGRPQRAANNLDQYISGLDGPLLQEVVAQMETMPMGMERARPSFVSMRKLLSASKRSSGRLSGGQYGLSGGMSGLHAAAARYASVNDSLATDVHNSSPSPLQVSQQ